MKLLEDKIRSCGKILPGDVLRVDNFVNHMIDVPFMREAVKEYYRAFKDSGVTKILTVEASGIAVASLAALDFGCPVLFAKKTVGSNAGGDPRYTTPCVSYTKGKTYDLSVTQAYLTKEDNVLILDDFLASGSALCALIELCRMAGAKVVGCGTVIEKAYQKGGDMIRARGIPVVSLARVKAMTDDGGIEFCD